MKPSICKCFANRKGYYCVSITGLIAISFSSQINDLENRLFELQVNCLTFKSIVTLANQLFEFASQLFAYQIHRLTYAIAFLKFISKSFM